MKKTTTIMINLLVIIMISLAACGPASTPAVEPQATEEIVPTLAVELVKTEEVAATPEETTLRIATLYIVSTLDAIKSAQAGDITMTGQLYSRLFRANPDGSLEPGLAESYEVSPDNTTYTFHLRDAKFSDGEPITAQDVVFSYLRLRDNPDSAYSSPFKVIKDVQAVDTKTVVITLDAPAGTFPGAFEMYNAGIVPQHAVEAMGEEEFGKMPVVSGPYKVREWRPNDRVILERNPYYWREGLPIIDVVEIIEVPNDNTRVSMLRSGEVDVIQSTPWVNLEEMKKEEGIKVPLDSSTIINIILLNHKLPLIQNFNVRKAMALGIDVKAIVDSVTFGNAKVANSLLPSALQYYNPDQPAFEYNPDEAKRLVEEAGAVGAEIEFLVVSGSSDQELSTLLIQDQLKKIGLNVKITQVDLSTWWEMVPAGEYGATITWWYNETPDPDLAVRWALCGTCGVDSFYSFYNNERINELTELGLRAPDQEQRKLYYYELQKIAMDEVGQIPLYYPPYTVAMSTAVENLMMTPAIQWTLEGASINR